MKKIFLNLFVLAAVVFATSCSSDDDNGNDGGSEGQLVATIDGEVVTFNSVIVQEYTYTEGDYEYTEYDITATVDNGTGRIITFYFFEGDLGADSIFDFYYTLDGAGYYPYNCNNYDFASVVTVNNGSRFEANFSGTLCAWDNANQQEVSLSLTNGSISVDL